MENTLSASALEPGKTEIRARILDIRGYAAPMVSFTSGPCIACIAACIVGLGNLFTKERYVENSIHSLCPSISRYSMVVGIFYPEKKSREMILVPLEA